VTDLSPRILEVPTGTAAMRRQVSQAPLAATDTRVLPLLTRARCLLQLRLTYLHLLRCLHAVRATLQACCEDMLC
jgi:hypothetical protein